MVLVRGEEKDSSKDNAMCVENLGRIPLEEITAEQGEVNRTRR